MNIVCDKILELLREELGESRNIKKFFLGNPEEIATSELPCIFVQPIAKDVEQLDNFWDLMTCQVMIGVCVDPASYQKKDLNEATAERFLMEMEGGRNADGTPNVLSVTYVMRHHFTLENTVVYQDQRTVWGEREMTGGVAREIHLYFTLKVKINNTS